jgi:hypothetical protein
MTADDDAASLIVRLIASAGDVAGTALGAIVGVSTGDPALIVAGAISGSVFGNAVEEVATRALSNRQKKRAGVLIVEALAVVRAREASGEKRRADGFFDGDHSSGDEFIEGVLRAAMDEFEERKVPYLANLLASVYFDDTIDISSAHHTIRLANELSWIELEMLGIFWAAEISNRFVLPDQPISDEISSWFDATINQTYIDLSDRYRLIHQEKVVTTPDALFTYNLNLSAVNLTNSGRLVAGLMNLNEIPQADLAPIYDALTAPATAP